MKIKYCRKYEKYVSRQHCEFFNAGRACEFYSPMEWASIKDLLMDESRPKWQADAVIKPFKCDLLDRRYLNQRNRRRQTSRHSLGMQS